jgi:hypothetical protein
MCTTSIQLASADVNEQKVKDPLNSSQLYEQLRVLIEQGQVTISDDRESR